MWRRPRHPTPVLLPGKSHGRRSLVGCSPWGREESDTTERLPFHFSLSCIGEGNGNPLQYSCLENPRDRGAWWAAVYGVAQSQTRLKWLSSSSSRCSLLNIIVKSHTSRGWLLIKGRGWRTGKKIVCYAMSNQESFPTSDTIFKPDFQSIISPPTVQLSSMPLSEILHLWKDWVITVQWSVLRTCSRVIL